MTQTDAQLREIFRSTRTIAVVGFSSNPARPSHYVAKFLIGLGYRVIPVNPGLAGQEFLGTTVRASFADAADEVDMVDVFRRSEEVAQITADALARWPGLRTIWLQLGISDPQSAALAGARGVTMVANRCPMIEIPRLFTPAEREELAGRG